MKVAACSLAGAAALIVALGACTTVVESTGPAKSHSASAPASSAPPSSSARAITSPQSAPSQSAPSQSAPSSPAQAAPPASSPNVTDPWAVVSAYYGDIESGNYQQAWALLNSGATTGQTYQQFVDGFACTGSQDLSELSESGNQVTFSLSATDTCNGQVQHFTGTDTVENGKIVAADVHQD